MSVPRVYLHEYSSQTTLIDTKLVFNIVQFQKCAEKVLKAHTKFRMWEELCYWYWYYMLYVFGILCYEYNYNIN